VGAVQSALGVGECGLEVVVLATRSLQFAKAGSAAARHLRHKTRNIFSDFGYFVFSTEI
jgi:hypothetical protein